MVIILFLSSYSPSPLLSSPPFLPHSCPLPTPSFLPSLTSLLFPPPSLLPSSSPPPLFSPVSFPLSFPLPPPLHSGWYRHAQSGACPPRRYCRHCPSGPSGQHAHSCRVVDGNPEDLPACHLPLHLQQSQPLHLA